MTMCNLRVLTMYLPQFYKVKENDEWWGEGFTDWTSMDEAKPLFEGHKQPKHPLNGNKYNLLDKNTMIWQANLMKKYGINGQCFYHYWFEKGKQILEKPAENLLKWKDIDMSYCFCWANESWIRSWSKYTNGNVWTTSNESQISDKDGFLLKQDYGDETEWKKHFLYLLPFFQDNRYIRIGGKPIFVFYKIDEIPCIEEMITCWNIWAKENGLKGIYTIGFNFSKKGIQSMDAELVHEPVTTFKEYYSDRFFDSNKPKLARYIPYDEIWKHILERQKSKIKTYWSGFTRYDSTPRRGYFGNVVYNETPEKFKIYLTELFAKSVADHNELVFINAWNEWGEGMYLEPDEEDGYEYLTAFQYAREHFMDEVYKYLKNCDKTDDITELLKLQVSRYKTEANILNRWIDIPFKEGAISEKMNRLGYHCVAVYAMGMVGKRLVEGLQCCNVLLCGIDKNARNINMCIPIYLPSDELPEIDLVVVSIEHVFEEIKHSLSNRVKCKIISVLNFMEILEDESI